MNKSSIKPAQTEKKNETQSSRDSFSVSEATSKQPLVVSEFERAPLTDINFGF